MLPNDVVTATRLTRTIALEIPVVSAAMDTVTEARMAIALARLGGMGVLHRNLSIPDQVAEVGKVKRSEARMIVEPVTLSPDALVEDALELMQRYRVSGIPITDADDRLVGILTNRDLRFGVRPMRVSDAMTKEGLVTAPVGTTLEEGAGRSPRRHRIEKLPIVDLEGGLRGLHHREERISKREAYPLATKDERGGCVSPPRSVSERTRSSALRRSSTRMSTRSSSMAHGHSLGVVDMVRAIGTADVEIIAGNIATAEAAEALIEAGADAIKVGGAVGHLHDPRRGGRGGAPGDGDLRLRGLASEHDVPLVADGGITASGDIARRSRPGRTP